MKRSLALLFALTGSLWAGDSKTPVSAPPPAPEPQLWNWFIGGSAGYLLDFEEGFYTGHIGVDTPYQFAGWNVAIYAEGGYTDKDETTSVIDPNVVVALVNRPLTGELEIVPITLNVKFERQLTGNLNAYWGLGVGVALTDFNARANFAPGPVPDVNVSESDTVFAGQVFAGLIYNFNENVELFGGARWIYINSEDNTLAKALDIDFESDVNFELGARFTF